MKKLPLFCWLLVTITHAWAEDFDLAIHDDQGRGIEHAVVALVPLKEISSNQRDAAVMDQRKNTFVPHVLAIQSNSLVYFPNSDDIRHHVYSFSPAKPFELRLYHGETAEPVLFDQPGKVVVGCNIHDSMLAYIYVLDTPYFGVTDADGKVIIPEPLPGDYRLELQHPQLDEVKVLEPMISWPSAPLNRQYRIDNISPLVAPEPTNELQRLFRRS